MEGRPEFRWMDGMKIAINERGMLALRESEVRTRDRGECEINISVLIDIYLYQGTLYSV